MHFPHLEKADLRRKFRAAMIASSVMMSPLAVSAQSLTPTAPTVPVANTTPIALDLAPPPESTPVPLPHRFLPLSSFAPLFNTADEKSSNIFFSNSRDAIREFRTLTNNPDATGPLSRVEVKMLADLRAEAAADVKKYKISLPVAATLRFAAQQTGMNYDVMVTRLQENAGNVMNVATGKLLSDNVYKFDVSTWLYLMKTQGSKHGMGFFADKIEVSEPMPGPTGKPTVKVSVADPTVLRQIISMRSNPRISLLLGGEYLMHEAEMPATAYKGMNYSYDITVADQQKSLMTIGFELGIRGADGVKGPLTTAALQEFALMSKPMLAQGQTLDMILSEAAAQALEDSAKYSARFPNITPATCFAVRHASKVAGVDFGYMMQLANAESGFDAGISASTSSATGLFQFIDKSWLTTLYKTGGKYGLTDIANNIIVQRNHEGVITAANIKNPFIEKYVIGLKTDPRVMALMGAEFARENLDNLQAALPSRNITRTDQYLAHFLGDGQAVEFIVKLNREPAAAAKTIFPKAAVANKGVFYKHGRVPRTLMEVYDLFKNKFSSTFFDTPAAPVPPANIPLPPPRPPGLN